MAKTSEIANVTRRLWCERMTAETVPVAMARPPLETRAFIILDVEPR
jgi:hypothetical protein